MISSKKISIDQIESSSLTTRQTFNAFTASYSTGSFTGSFIGRATGSFTGSFTGSLFGTASWSLNSISSSQAINAQTASFAPNYTLSSSFNNFTSSYNTGSFTGSFIGNLIGTSSFAQTSSYVDLGYTPENITNKNTGSLTNSTSSYPSDYAVSQSLNNKADLVGGKVPASQLLEVEQQLQRYWYSMTANTLNTTLMLVNNTNSFTTSGTASVVPRAGTLYYNSIAMNNYLSATANGSNCGIKNSNQGDGSYLEGFDSTFVFINNDTNIDCETTVGYYGLLSAIPNIDKVNYTTDFVGVGNDVGDTNLSFYCRRNTLGVSFTKVDCGSAFPAHTTTDAYIFRMQMSRGYDGTGRTLKMTIINIITGAVFSHTFTDTQIPSHTRNIAMVVNRSNRNTGVATNIRFSKWHQTKYIY